MLLAAEWSIKPVVVVGYAYNDNLKMKVIPDDGVSITTIKPSIDFAWASERTEIDIKGDWRREMYSTTADREDNTIEIYSFNSTHKTERNRLGLKADITKSTTLTQDNYNESLGVVYQELDQQIWKVTPSWLWIMTETSSVKLEYSYQAAEYEKYYTSNLNDYSYNSTGITYFYQWAEKDQIYATVSYSQYEMVDTTNVAIRERPTTGVYTLTSISDTTSFQLGINHNFTEAFKMGLGYGSRSTESESLFGQCYLISGGRCDGTRTDLAVTRSDMTSPVYTLTAEQNLELTNISLNFSRKISASGLGSEVQIDNIDINIARDITSLTNLSLKLSENKNEASNAAFSSNDRDQYRGTLKLDWHFSRNWNLDWQYRYTQIKNRNTGTESDSNYYAMTVRYNWDKFSVSR
ncbi:MAG: hypothetical protein OEY89_15790 [Gammaproteobacteria bacterium]|nr:hypothetical protein [Gammaproteobacteria bacterium]